jgi:hypothetical protein
MVVSGERTERLCVIEGTAQVSRRDHAGRDRPVRMKATMNAAHATEGP